MKQLNIPPTENTLGIHYNVENHHLLLEGSSFPENAQTFFSPLFDWLERRIETKAPLSLEMNFNYLNSGSIKCILTILRMLGEFHGQGGEVKAIWKYAPEDEDIKDLGERISRLAGLPLELALQSGS